MKVQYSNRLILILLISLFSCTKTDKNEIIHPQKQFIPYQDQEGIPFLKAEDIKDVQDLPDLIQILHQYLNDELEQSFTELPFLLDNSFGAKLATINNSLFVMHIGSSILHEINLETSESYQIASFGRGPGSIAHANDLISYQDKLYVIGKDRRINIFTCSVTPCESERVVMIDKSGLSGFVTDSLFIIITQPELGSEIEQQELSKPISIYDINGNKLKESGSFYQTENWLIQDIYLQGDVLYNENSQQHILYFSHIPQIYIYDSEFNFDFKFTIEDFEQSTVHYNTERRSRRVNTNSLISNINYMGNGHYVVTVSHNNDEVDDQRQRFYNRKYDYYFFDLVNRHNIYVGSYSHAGYISKDVQLTPLGLLVNQGGELKLLN